MANGSVGEIVVDRRRTFAVGEDGMERLSRRAESAADRGSHRTSTAVLLDDGQRDAERADVVNVRVPA